MTGESHSKGSGIGRSLLRPLRLVERVIAGSGAAIIFVTLSFTFCALLVNVVLRYAFGSGLAWAYEIHAILFPWLVDDVGVPARADEGDTGLCLIGHFGTLR